MGFAEFREQHTPEICEKKAYRITEHVTYKNLCNPLDSYQAYVKFLLRTVRSDFNSHEVNTRDPVVWFGHNSAPRPSLDLLLGQNAFFKSLRPSYTYQDPQMSCQHVVFTNTFFAEKNEHVDDYQTFSMWGAYRELVWETPPSAARAIAEQLTAAAAPFEDARKWREPASFVSAILSESLA